jgi:DNA-binding LytR/AlgR family response regulator
MINCIIVDDEQHAIDLLLRHISKLPLLQVQLATTNAVEAFQYVQQHQADLIFLDVQMPDLTGMQFLKLFKGKSKVILTTAYPEHALEGYEHDVIDYLLKPIVFERFLKAAQKAIDAITVSSSGITSNQTNQEDFLFLKTEGRKMVKVLLKDIEYAESLGNYLAIHTSSKKIIILLTMKELAEKLPAHQFIRIHNSYLVALNKITEVNGNQLQLQKQKLPIGESYKKSFLKVIEKDILNKL